MPKSLHIRQLNILGGLGVLVLGMAAPPALAQANPEFRAMWVSRFDGWLSSNPNTCKANIDAVMNNLQTHRFNAVVFQVRGQCDTLYPSPEEPWSPILSSDGNTPPLYGTFDPLAYAISAAHSRGLEFHAYINTHACWGSSTTVPSKLTHVYYTHCNAANASARDWLVHDSNGTPTQFVSEYTWMAPGVPAMQAYVRRQIMHVVRNYDVDGVHFDRIRSPGTDYSYDPISQARRLNAGSPNTAGGNPAGLAFADWTRDQFTRFCRDLYAEVSEVKPQVKVSSAPLGLYRQSSYPGYPSGFLYGYTVCYQDAQGWIKAGAMDFLCPQIYWADGGSLPDFSDLLPDWVANQGGRHIVAGHNRSTGVTEMISNINFTRANGGAGNVAWSYSGFNSGGYWSSYSGAGGPYAQPAAVPAMPWKTAPTKATILGKVTQSGGGVLTDCQVTGPVAGYTGLSSADGLYSFLLVNPGTYTLTFNKQGLPVRQVPNVTVTAGQVLRLDVTVGGQGPTITQPPVSYAACPGEPASFTVAATGQGTLAYQWRYNGADLANGGAISGANTSTLTINPVSGSNTGNYGCLVSDSGGSTSTSTAVLTLDAGPAITQQPLPTVLTLNGAGSLTVAGSGTGPLTYHWDKDGVELADGDGYTGTQAATLNISGVNVNHAGLYQARVTGRCGTSPSNTVAVTVRGVPGDFDLDGDVDGEDYGHLQECLTGSAMAQNLPSCQDALLDGDADVDGADVDRFLACFSGPNVPAEVTCGG